jgi:hypothetical protein
MKLIIGRRIVVLIVVLLSFSLVGCYTLLKHPQTGELAEESDFTRCSACHPEYPYIPPETGPLPWWWGPVVIVKEKDRPIVKRDPERSDDWKRIEPGLGIVLPPGQKPPVGKPPDEPPATPPAQSDGGTVTKDVKGGNQSDTSRPIHEREPEKGSGDSKQSDSKDKK